MKEFFAKTKNGLDVFMDTETCHALTHFAHNPKLSGLAKKSISNIDVEQDITRVSVDCGEIAGTTDLVETGPHDEIVYAKRLLRSGYSRFVKNKESVATTWITIDIRKDAAGGFYLHTAFVGEITPSFPGGDFMPEQSKEFWAHHALVWGPQEIVPGSETTESPWEGSPNGA